LNHNALGHYPALDFVVVEKYVVQSLLLEPVDTEGLNSIGIEIRNSFEFTPH